MAFLSKTDLVKAIRTEELDQITRNDSTLISYGCDAAVGEIKSYLVAHFDCDTIFAQTGSNRNALLLNFAVDIAIYIIVANALPAQDLEDRRARYKRAIDWLKGIASGELNSDLPMITPDTDQPNTRGKIGSHTKRNNYYE